jgi:hypothetical protein
MQKSNAEKIPVRAEKLQLWRKQFRLAGYTKTTPDLAVRVYLRDFNKLQAAAATRHVAA